MILPLTGNTVGQLAIIDDLIMPSSIILQSLLLWPFLSAGCHSIASDWWPFMSLIRRRFSGYCSTSSPTYQEWLTIWVQQSTRFCTAFCRSSFARLSRIHWKNAHAGRIATIQWVSSEESPSLRLALPASNRRSYLTDVTITVNVSVIGWNHVQIKVFKPADHDLLNRTFVFCWTVRIVLSVGVNKTNFRFFNFWLVHWSNQTLSRQDTSSYSRQDRIRRIWVFRVQFSRMFFFSENSSTPR